MRTYSLIHLRDQDLLDALTALVSRHRITTAEMLAHLAEVDARRLYLPAAHASMHAYCVQALRLSEDAASKRIRAARAAREFPVIFEAVAEGRLSLSAVLLLAPHLKPATAASLLGAAEGKSRFAIEQLLAERFPRTELLALVQPLSAPASSPQSVIASSIAESSAPGRMILSTSTAGSDSTEASPSVQEQALRSLAPALATHAPAPRPTIKPHAAGRYALQLTMGQSVYDKLLYAQALLGHAVPTGDVVEVLSRALDSLITTLERRKFAATRTPRPAQERVSADPRHIPAHVKREVWERDQGRCAFVSASGERCTERARIEFDHVDPVARGGRATTAGMRPLCRAHNQFEAERMFGASFMHRQRERAREAVPVR